MIVRFMPENHKGGVVSILRWDQPQLQDALRTAFAAGDHERLTMVDITAEGIRGYFSPAAPTSTEISSKQETG